MKKNDDDDDNTVFPIVESNDVVSVSSGLTKRELFAAMAMQGDWAAQNEYCGEFTGRTDLRKRAALYVKMADALIAVLETETETKAETEIEGGSNGQD